MRLFPKLMMLGALAFLGYSNLDMLDSSINVIRKVQVGVSGGIEMRNICRAVLMHYVNTGEIPLRNFSAFLAENTTEYGGKDLRNNACDMWGTPYALGVRGTDIVVMSAGPDKIWRTADDLQCAESLTKVEIPQKVLVDIQRALYGGTASSAASRTGTRTGSVRPRGRRRRKPYAPSGWQLGRAPGG